MTVAAKNFSQAVGDDWKQYAAGSHNLLADSPHNTCARRIVALIPVNQNLLETPAAFSSLVNAAGADKPVTGFREGYVHDGHVQSITSNVAFW